MKVISLLQPWASLVVIGAKKIETRSWNTKYRGPLLIHASKRWDWELNDIVGKIGADAILRQAGYHALAPVKGKPKTNLPLGAIIGKVNMDRTIPFNEQFQMETGKVLSNQELDFGDYSPGRYGWILSYPVKFNHPIPAKGSLSIWDFQFPGRDENHILQCDSCGYTACNDAFGLHKMNIDTEGEDWDVWCPKCEGREQTLIIDQLP